MPLVPWKWRPPVFRWMRPKVRDGEIRFGELERSLEYPMRGLLRKTNNRTFLFERSLLFHERLEIQRDHLLANMQVSS